MPPVKIMDNGPDADRMVIVVLGDGYAQADQAKYRDDVRRLVVNGVLAHDVYGDNRRAFNVYRVDLVSAETGVSTPTKTKDTALKLVYTGKWNSCWIRPSAQTTARIKAAVKGIDYNLVLLVCNENGFGGCQSSNRMYITSGINWDLVAHEYGHAIAGLFDEYVEKNEDYPGPAINNGNCSTVLDRGEVVWKSLIAAATQVPTKLGGGVGAATVGMFEGCNAYKKKIYRPADNCLMRESDQNPPPPFCPVCRPLMTAALAPYLPPNPGGGHAGHNDATGGEAEIMGEGNKDAGGSYLFVELSITPDGEFEVLSAEEMPGTPVAQKAPVSRFAYEVVTGNDSLSVETLGEDPFVSRSFPEPNSGQYHREVRTDSTVLNVRIPVSASGLADSQNEISLRFYAVDPGADVSTLDAATLPAMNDGGQLQLRAEIPADRLRSAILEKLE
ncbi:MAG TPA: M64 family metallopeptidase [Pyrinomonadaceae bacterium]|jgi:hypothetical protein